MEVEVMAAGVAAHELRRDGDRRGEQDEDHAPISLRQDSEYAALRLHY